jgi:hypothetical protein
MVLPKLSPAAEQVLVQVSMAMRKSPLVARWRSRWWPVKVPTPRSSCRSR